MTKKYSILLGFCIVLCLAFYFKHSVSVTPQTLFPPTGDIEIFNGHEEGTGKGNKRRAWMKDMHRAAPGVDWKKMDQDHRWKTYQKKLQSSNQKVQESFGSGIVNAEWVERGSIDQAGNMANIDYDPRQDAVYGISGGGTLWKSDINGSSWRSLNEDLQFDERILDHIYYNGVHRIFTSINKRIYYSDDDGVTWSPSTGLLMDPFGFAVQIESTDNGEVYYLAFTQDNSVSDTRMWLYYSNNGGVSFTKIKTFAHSTNYWAARNYTRMWSSKRTNKVYINHLGSQMHVAQNGAITQTTGSTGLPTLQDLDIEGSMTTLGALSKLFILIGDNKLYESTDEGMSWTQKSTLNTNTWDVGIGVNEYNESQLYYGEVEAFRSGNGGTSWTKQNTWGSYYSNIDKLHADIMDIEFFRKLDGTTFALIANHGGVHISYDHVITTNISKSGLNINQLYDVVTHPNDDDYIFGGTQDQGWLRTNDGVGYDEENFEQVISGDYGHFAFSNNGNSVWTVYPGTSVQFYPNAKTSYYTGGFDINGSNESNNGWIGTTAETSNPTDNAIYVAGGNINGGPGSYLITMTAGPAPNYNISVTQNSYDFYTNANSGNSTISAIENSLLNPNQIYVATADGTFFYSNNNGGSWSKTTSFTGPGDFWLYGSTILASTQVANRVWYGGSGYSNPAVYISNDGGATFTAAANGLPSTLVYELAANDTETLLFAATELGPYMYEVATNQWYPIMGVGAPVQQYYSVEYISNLNIVRFGTYGRGIWDFVIDGNCIVNDVITSNINTSVMEEANKTITSSSTINGNLNVSFDAGECIELRSGFEVPASSNFETKLVGCN